MIIKSICDSHMMIIYLQSWGTGVLQVDTECAEYIHIINNSAKEAGSVIVTHVRSWVNPKYRMETGGIKTAGNIGI